MNPLLLIWVALAFILGACVGSGLNVCIFRIPYEKSILWPGSHCGRCFQPVHWYDNLPLVSYWVLRGRCRSCGASFSIRYFCIELFTALTFAGLFWLDVVVNVHRMPAVENASWMIQGGFVPLNLWLLWGGHCLLAAFLIVTSMCDLDHMEIPLSITITGMLFGLLLSCFFAWPWPNTTADMLAARRLDPGNPVPVLGFHPWPLWDPAQLPVWMGPGTWQLGLATGLAGVLAGMLVLRAVRFLFGLGRGVEGLGLGDADIMMMVGAFLGWQAVIVAFFVSVFPALVLGLGQILFRGTQLMPFGPSLALGSLLTLYGWRWIGPYVRMLFFDGTMLLILGGVGAVLLLFVSFVLRLMRGEEMEEEGEPGASAPGPPESPSLPQTVHRPLEGADDEPAVGDGR